MPYDPCPCCHRLGHNLPTASLGSRVDYYRCEGCGHVWCYAKGRPDSARCDVTPPRGSPRADVLKMAKIGAAD